MVGENSWDRGVCWEKLVGTLASDDGGTLDLMESVETPTSVVDLWSGLTLIENDCGTRAEAARIGPRPTPVG